jgi:hypothetical protein
MNQGTILTRISLNAIPLKIFVSTTKLASHAWFERRGVRWSTPLVGESNLEERHIEAGH